MTLVGLLQGQMAAQLQTGSDDVTGFDVVSVKPTGPDSRAGVRSTPGHFVATNHPLSYYILEAYGIMDYQLIGAPPWIYREHFDIEATVEKDIMLRRTLQPEGPIRFMPPLLEGLLEKRFALRVRRETRDMQMYRLVRARANGSLGPNLRQVAVDCEPKPGIPSPCSFGGLRPGYAAVGIVWPGYLIGSLINSLRAHVSDQTGLSGQFDVRLEWTPDLATTVDTVPATERVSVFTAVQEQLGLKLEPTRGPVEVLVIEHVERPSPN